MTVKKDGITFVDDVGGGAGADVNIASYGGVATSLGQKTAAQSIPVVLASDFQPTGRTNSGTLGAFAAEVVLQSLKWNAAVCAIYIADTGAFDGTIKLSGLIDFVHDFIDKVYDVENDQIISTVQNGVPLGRLLWVPCGGLDEVRVVVTSYVSGSCDASLAAGNGTLNMPKMPADQTISGTITALNGTVTLPLKGLGGISARFSGVWSASLQFQISLDGGINYTTVFPNIIQAGAAPGTILNNGEFTLAPGPGVTHVRVIASGFISGTVNVTIRANTVLPTPLATAEGFDGGDRPFTSVQLGGLDNTVSGTFEHIESSTDTPNTGATGLVTREVARGQQTMAASIPVVVASDQTGIPIKKTDLTPSAPTAASVGVASAQAVAANANRKGLILVNTSTNRISLGFGSAAVLDSGVTLYPNGGSYSMGEYDFDLGAVNAIASGATSNLAIQEYTT